MMEVGWGKWEVGRGGMLEVGWEVGGASYDDGSGMGEVGSGKRWHVGSGIGSRWCVVG